MTHTQIVRRARVVALVLAAAISLPLFAQSAYPTPDEAAAALVKAIKDGDEPAMVKVLGEKWRDYVPTDNIDRDDVDAFLNQYDDSHRIVKDGDDKGHLTVGPTNWTLPIPLVHKGSGWSFDPIAGHDEIIKRQIGANELFTVQAVQAYCDAQDDYSEKDRNGDGVREYAQRFISTEGKHDGLYWPTKEGEPPSPLGPAFDTKNQPSWEGYHGYHYRILKAQGPSAPGGAYDYVVGGRLRNGYAVIAWPAHYGESGVMTFTTSHDGEVFQKDLGKNTATLVTKITKFDPDDSWTELKTDELDKK